MIIEFEKALVEKYVPTMLPELISVKFAEEEFAFQHDKKVVEFPSALIYRSLEDNDFCPRYTYEDALNFTVGFPYQQTYTIKVFCSRQDEVLYARRKMRLFHARNPYVFFEYGGDFNFHIGLRLISTGVKSESDFYSDKGPVRTCEMKVLANLVMVDTIAVKEIREVVVRQNKEVLDKADHAQVDASDCLEHKD